jgi:hypothetical protein
MEKLKPLQALFLVYDFLRVAAVAALTAFFAGSGDRSLAEVFPYIAHAAPNCLFPLMSFFLLVKPQEHRAYLPLYMAGKTVGIAAFIGWIYFQTPYLQIGLSAGFPVSVWLLGVSFLIFVADIGTIAGVYITMRRF